MERAQPRTGHAGAAVAALDRGATVGRWNDGSMPDTRERSTVGTTAAAISNSVVKLTSEYTGRGPTKARTTITEDMVIVLMPDTLLKAERTLVESGQADTVREMRRRFQAAMRSDLIAVVEEHTGRNVAAFMSDNHIDPDFARRSSCSSRVDSGDGGNRTHGLTPSCR